MRRTSTGRRARAACAAVLGAVAAAGCAVSADQGAPAVEASPATAPSSAPGADDARPSSTSAEAAPTPTPVVTSDGARSSGPDGGAGPGAEEGQLSPVTLYVSNQSFDEPTVRLSVRVGTTVVADREFEVEDQHTWVEFGFELPPGEHEMTVKSDTGLTETFRFRTAEGRPRWLVVEHWWDDGARGGGGRLTFDSSDEAVGFD